MYDSLLIPFVLEGELRSVGWDELLSVDETASWSVN